MMIPLYGFLQGDTMGLVIVVHDTDTVGEMAGKLRQAANVRCVGSKNFDVLYHGVVLDQRLSVGDCGLEPLERFDVLRRNDDTSENQS